MPKQKKELVVITRQRHWKLLKKIRFSAGSHLRIISLVGGISVEPDCLDRVQKSGLATVEYLSLEKMNSEYTPTDISLLATNVVKSLMATVQKNGLSSRFYREVDLLRAVSNLAVVALKPVIAFILSLQDQVEAYNPDTVYLFGHQRLAFELPERATDVTTLYNNEATFCPISIQVLQKMGRDYQVIPSSKPLFVRLQHVFRHLAIFAYKFLKTLQRTIVDYFYRAKRPACPPNKRCIAILIRAESEYWSVQPVLDALKKHQEFFPIVLQDDVIKDPSGRRTLIAQQEPFVPIHQKRFLLHTIGCFILAEFRRLNLLKAAKPIVNIVVNHKPEEMTGLVYTLLYTPPVLLQTLRAISASFPELSNFIDEVNFFMENFDPQAFICMDMIDQWIGVLSGIGQAINCPVFMLQTATIDRLILPQPVASDVAWVAGKYVSDTLILSGATPEQVMVTGLPKYDRFYNTAEKMAEVNVYQRLEIPTDHKIVLVTTQPINGEFYYNEHLLEAVGESLADIEHVTVVVKVHPREKIEAFSEAFSLLNSRMNGRAHLVVDINVLYLIQASSLFISRFSATMMDSVLAGVPTIAFLDDELKKYCRTMDYLSSDVTIKLFNKKELNVFMRDVFFGKRSQNFKYNFDINRGRYIEEFIGQFDGRATKQVIWDLEKRILK